MRTARRAIRAALVLACAWSGLNGAALVARGADAAALTQEGWAHWQKGEMTEAIAKFEEAVKADPKNANAWNGLGWANFNSGNPDEAMKAFEKVVAISPNHAAALNGLGQICLSQRKYDKAEKYLLKAAGQAPAAWYGLARLYLLQGKYEKAQKWAQKVVSSGQADDTMKEMLKAAKEKKLSDELRASIEPPEPAEEPSGADAKK